MTPARPTSAQPISSIRRLLRGFFAVMILGLVFTAYIFAFHRYWPGQEEADADRDGIPNGRDMDADGDGFSALADGDADGDGLPNAEDLAGAAREFTGILYGGFRSVGARLGFLVCSDIPRLAYARAGIPLATLMADEFARSPASFDSEGGRNVPNTPWFFRRSRNIRAYFRSAGLLMEKCPRPAIGDIVFHGDYHCSLVVEVYPHGTVAEVETSGDRIWCRESRRPWVAQEVGRLLPPEQGP